MGMCILIVEIFSICDPGDKPSGLIFLQWPEFYSHFFPTSLCFMFQQYQPIYYFEAMFTVVEIKLAWCEYIEAGNIA